MQGTTLKVGLARIDIIGLSEVCACVLRVECSLAENLENLIEGKLVICEDGLYCVPKPWTRPWSRSRLQFHKLRIAQWGVKYLFGSDYLINCVH